ncbi:HopJ type III effector protein [Formosa sp. L2A11]|uniref:HopJ type III effector protein n=1 Tax=Formosa sp. L2A11 TaxID=2686363 RepID=UPI00131B7601|nr:HopJ type III effector protein [Formosa sp. L2A11]
MTLDIFKEKVQNIPKSVVFSDTMDVIDTYYEFSKTAFTNGDLHNNAGENSGSCKLFAFAKLQGFTKEETLACFGQFYYIDVLGDPEGNGHQNIRNFIKTGFEGLEFEGEPLKLK